MVEAFLRLKGILGSIIYELPDGNKEEVIHFSNVKFVRDRNGVACRDKDYWHFQESRVITNPKYLKRMEEIIMKLPAKAIKIRTVKKKRKHGFKEYIFHPNYFRSSIKGICKFGENLHLSLSESDKKKVIKALKFKTPKQVAMEFNLSESYCKHLWYKT